MLVCQRMVPLVIQHSHGKSQCSRGKSVNQCTVIHLHNSPWRSVKLPETKMGCVWKSRMPVFLCFFERKPFSPIFTIDSIWFSTIDIWFDSYPNIMLPWKFHGGSYVLGEELRFCSLDSARRGAFDCFGAVVHVNVSNVINQWWIDGFNPSHMVNLMMVNTIAPLRL